MNGIETKIKIGSRNKILSNYPYKAIQKVFLLHGNHSTFSSIKNNDFGIYLPNMMLRFSAL